MSDSKPKRLAPRPETLRELFLKSGNLCAFSNCTSLMMDVNGTFIGQLCHIEAAEEGGERFNPRMSNEERRSASNLMLMCYAHHQVTNDERKYPVKKLVQMKLDHERRFSAPDRAILERLIDWTTVDTPLGVKNLRRVNEVLEWGHSSAELQEALAELNGYVDLLQRVPIDVRRFIGAIAQRMNRVRNTSAVSSEQFGTKILIADVKAAFRLSDSSIRQKISQLDSYDIGDFDEIETDFGPQPALRIRSLRSGWKIWPDVIKFCEITNTPIEKFTEDLEFSRLDA